MLDRPDTAALLKAMARTLSDEVMPATKGATRHAVRVVANLCRILEREVQQGQSASEETRLALAQLLDQDGTLPELVAALDQRLQSPDAEFEEAARPVLLADVERRLAINRPGYGS
ncbi:MAG: DUF6285 domain-containing protein [Myxococcota bacterium]